tara:strand:+ start:152 stop:673 length:522 start_codon:yes stop_codon:yes gene_type:complete
MSLETPKYSVLDKEANFEIRSYKSFIVAQTDVQDEYKQATSMGFRRIANYIFGGNDKNIQIPMTAPVISTSPAINPDFYEVMFFMPSNFSLKSLPNPNLESVKLVKLQIKKVAALKFGGWATKENCLKYQKRLENWLQEKSIKTDSGYLVAQYNSPWAIPPFRKNEILVRLID